MAEEKREPVYNADGTHVFVTTPSGDSWECPPGYLEVALKRGFELAAAPVDPLADPVMDPASKSTAKKAAKSSNPGD